MVPITLMQAKALKVGDVVCFSNTDWTVATPPEIDNAKHPERVRVIVSHPTRGGSFFTEAHLQYVSLPAPVVNEPEAEIPVPGDDGLATVAPVAEPEPVPEAPAPKKVSRRKVA